MNLKGSIMVLGPMGPYSCPVATASVYEAVDIVQSYIAEHPDVKVLDPIENVMWLSDRHQQYQFVHDCDVVDESRFFCS